MSQSLVVTPGTVEFGDVLLGDAATSNVDIANNAPVAVVISQMDITGQAFTVQSDDGTPISVPAGGKRTLQVGFTPSSATDYDGQVMVADASARPLGHFGMHGHGTVKPSRQLALSATSLDFGNVPVNGRMTQSLTVTSSGTSPVTVSAAAIAQSGFTVVGGSLPAMLKPSESITFVVQFNPVATGVLSGSLTISSDATTSASQVVSLSGTGTAVSSPQPLNPQLTVSNASLDFGTLTVGDSKTQSVTLTSTGSSPVTVSAVAISGNSYSIVGDGLPVTLNPTQTVTVQVRFNPTVAGVATGRLKISSDSADGSVSNVSLSGTGAANGTTVTPNPQLTLSTQILSFGNVTVNSATTQPLTLTSTGTVPVTVNTVEVSGSGFTVAAGNLPATLNPDQSITLQVRFNPAVVGAASGQLTINSDSANNGTTMVSLDGTGTAAANPRLTVSAMSLRFGDVMVNTPTMQALTLTSTGSSTVTVNAAAITGTGFTIVGGTLPATLAPTQALTLQVQFNPTAAGASTGQLTINSDSANGGTTIVSLDGTGTVAVSPQLTLSAQRLGFGDVTVNTPTTQSLTLTSTGSSPVTASAATISGAGFTIVGGTLPATLAPTQSLTLQVQFNPTAAGVVNGQLTINSDSSSGGATVVSLNGTGTVAPSPQLTLSAQRLDFGSVALNTPVIQSLTLTSTGSSSVMVSADTISGTGFTVVGGTLPVTLAPTQTLTLQVQFNPAAAGASNGQLTITSDSSSSSVEVVLLNGTGTPTLSPQLTLNTQRLDFGSVALNTPATQSLTLSSTGTTPVTVNSATITGAGFTTIGGSFPITLNAGQTATVQLQFMPTVAGAATGQLTINSNSSSGGAVIITLNGTGMGAAVAHEVDLSWSAPVSSADLVVGYHIYRVVGGGSPLLLNSALQAPINFVDNNVVSGTTYDYVVKSVDASGVESVPSNTFEATIP